MDLIRKLYNVAHTDKTKCEELIEFCENSDNVLEKGYWAAAKMVSSKYLINPFIIIKVFNEGKNTLEKLILEFPNETELRYLRYTIQVNTPAFVGYNKNKQEDREIIFNFLNSNGDAKLKEHILFYLKNTNDLKEGELQIN